MRIDARRAVVVHNVRAPATQGVKTVDSITFVYIDYIYIYIIDGYIYILLLRFGLPFHVSQG